MRSHVHRILLFTVDLTVQSGTELLAISISEKLMIRTRRGHYSIYIFLANSSLCMLYWKNQHFYTQVSFCAMQKKKNESQCYQELAILIFKS